MERLSLGLAAAPTILMTTGEVSKLSNRERVPRERKKVLENIRGTSDVHAEGHKLHSFLCTSPVSEYRIWGNASLHSSALTGAVLASSTFISIATVDNWGRRALLISVGIQMVVCQV